MTVQEIADVLSLEVVAGAEHLGNEVSGGYASDLLSCVMARAKAGNVWVTLQAHANVVAVASLLGLAAVIITENHQPDEETLARAEENGVPLLLTAETTYAVVGKLVGLGVAASA